MLGFCLAQACASFMPAVTNSVPSCVQLPCDVLMCDAKKPLFPSLYFEHPAAFKAGTALSSTFIKLFPLDRKKEKSNSPMKSS